MYRRIKQSSIRGDTPSWCKLSILYIMGCMKVFVVNGCLNSSLVHVIPGKAWIEILFSVVKISSASLVMAVAVQVLKYFLEPFTGTNTFIGIFMQGAISGGVGIIFFFASCYFLQSPELMVFAASVKKRLLKKYKPREVVPGN